MNGWNAWSIRAGIVVGPPRFTVTGLKSETYEDAGNGTIIALYTLVRFSLFRSPRVSGSLNGFAPTEIWPLGVHHHFV